MKSEHKTWFTKWFLDNKVTVVLLNVLLIFLIIAAFIKVSYIFKPIQQILGIILPPLIVAGILYYLIDPLIDLLEQRCHVKRVWSISIVFIVILAVLVWFILSLIPIIQNQATSLVHNIPQYWRTLQKMLINLSQEPHLQRLHLANKLSPLKLTKSFSNSLNGVFNNALGNITSAVGVVTNVVMIILTAPFVLFFMLKDDHKIKPSIIKYMPERLQASVSDTLTEINQALSSYVRGQLTVAFWVAVMFAIGYLIVGMPYGVLLGIFAGICNLIPYVGSAVGLIPAIVLGLINGQQMLLYVIIIFAIEQTIETRVVSPLVVGNKMNMHPVTTIFVLLVSGGMFGLIGVIGGIPIYAIIKIFVGKIFAWIQRNSSWYDSDEEQSTDSTTN
ncbi:MAG: AI-2E family transporter [Lactobacillus sp.]|nr:AI-2E family transporter [Lactobacillus sp.]